MKIDKEPVLRCFGSLLSFRFLMFRLFMSVCRQLRVLLHAFANRRLFLLFFYKVEPGLRQKKIHESWVAVHHKVDIPVIAETVDVLVHRDRFSPDFVVTGNTAVPIFLANRIGKDVEDPLIIKLL